MKKIQLIILTGCLTIVIFSCTPSAIEGNNAIETGKEQACCGGGDIPIPPPPKG